MKVDVILGLQWGDEGKGKIVDVFTPHYDIIARKRPRCLASGAKFCSSLVLRGTIRFDDSVRRGEKNFIIQAI
jgi:hypothetical protein